MDAAAARIVDKLWQRTLPTDEPGSGVACDGCDLVVTSKESEHEMEMPNGRVLRFHVACSGLWRILKQALPASVADRE